MTSMGYVENFSGLMAARWFLGMAEAGLFPGINYFLSCWYKRDEFGVRAVSLSPICPAHRNETDLITGHLLLRSSVLWFFRWPPSSSNRKPQRTGWQTRLGMDLHRRRHNHHWLRAPLLLHGP